MALLVTGVERTITSIKRMAVMDKASIGAAIVHAAVDVYKESQILVPVDKGPLKASGVISTGGSPESPESTVSYGGPAAPYSFVVHEDLEAYHAPPTCAKYLSRAVHRTRSRRRQIWDNAIKSRPTPSDFTVSFGSVVKLNIKGAVAVKPAGAGGSKGSTARGSVRSGGTGRVRIRALAGGLGLGAAAGGLFALGVGV